jgi:hypothetical protein
VNGLGVESSEVTEGLSGSIFSIKSIVRAGETGRLSGIGSRVVMMTPLASREGVVLEKPDEASNSRIAVSGDEVPSEECSHQSAKLSELPVMDLVSEN